MMLDILLKCGKHEQDRIISLSEETYAYKLTSLTLLYLYLCKGC
jgi:hypothetical protein